MDRSIRNGMYGLAIGDALGTPVEFCNREDLVKDPVTEMEGYGTYDVPAGTWSDNTSLALCLTESLSRSKEKCMEEGKTDNVSLAAAVDYEDIMNNFCRWFDEGAFSAAGQAFDVGHATQKAILLKKSGRDAIACGGTDERANGNGSLTRILPLAYYFSPIGDDQWDEVLDVVHKVSSLTHGHPISRIACGAMVSIADNILRGKDIESALERTFAYYEGQEDLKAFVPRFDELRDLKKFADKPESDVRCGTYVVDTIKAGLWAFLNSDNFKDCLIKAVNLGDDTDCIGAVAGALAGMTYGYDAIPEEWLRDLRCKEMIDEILDRFSA